MSKIVHQIMIWFIGISTHHKCSDAYQGKKNTTVLLSYYQNNFYRPTVIPTIGHIWPRAHFDQKHINEKSMGGRKTVLTEQFN